MNPTEIRTLYDRGDFKAVVDQLTGDWPKSGLPTDTYAWADACHLGMMSAYGLYFEADHRGDTAAAQGWDIQGALWRARSVACALHSHNLFAGTLNVIALANEAHFAGKKALAVQIAELAAPLLARTVPPGTTPASDYNRICAEQRAVLLCDAIRAGAMTGTLDEAIAEANKALACCGDDTRARVKVSGGIANMIFWNGDQPGGIAKTEAVLNLAREHNLTLFAEIAGENLQKMRAGKDDLRPYQVA